MTNSDINGAVKQAVTDLESGGITWQNWDKPPTLCPICPRILLVLPETLICRIRHELFTRMRSMQEAGASEHKGLAALKASQ